MLAAPPSVDVSGLQEEVDGLRATATQAQSTAERCMKRLADMGERLEALELQGPPAAAPAALPNMPSSAAAAAAGGELAVAGQAGYTLVWTEQWHHHVGCIQEQVCDVGPERYKTFQAP